MHGASTGKKSSCLVTVSIGQGLPYERA